MGNIYSALIFLTNTILDLYILIVMLRVILQWVGAKFYNPITQLIVKLTNPVIIPLRRILPPFKGIDLASFLVLLILEFIKLVLIIYLSVGTLPGIFGLVVIAFGELLDVILDIFFFAILINVIISWVNPMSSSPVNEILYLITEPLLKPIRKIIPPIAGFDLSPIPALIILQLCAMLITSPLINIGRGLALA